MKTTLTCFTALTVLLALSGEAAAGPNNFAPKMMNLPNMRPIIPPQIARPVITPRVDTSRLAKVPSTKPRPIKPAKRRARGSDPAPESNGPKQAENRRSGVAAITELPPLPRPRPKGWEAAGLPPLPGARPDRGIGNSDSNIGTGASGASGLPGAENGAPGQGKLAGVEERIGGLREHLEMFEAISRWKEIQDAVQAGNAFDAATNGGGGGGGARGQFTPDWMAGLTPEPNTKSEGPQNDKIWKPDASSGPTPYNPHVDQDGGSEASRGGSQWLGRPDGSSGKDRYMGKTPGSASAGAGIRGGGGTTSQDGGGSGSPGLITKTWTERRGSATVQVRETTDAYGNWQREEHRVHDNGDYENVRVTESRYGATRVQYQKVSAEEGPQEPVDVIYNKDGEEVRRRPEEGPDSQPNPENAGSGESMPCPKTSTGCGPSDGLMTYQPSKLDKVAQPGRGDNVDPAQGFTASVTERKNVVSQPNPADSGGGPRGGGGGGGYDPDGHMGLVTGPGGGDSGGPPQP